MNERSELDSIGLSFEPLIEHKGWDYKKRGMEIYQSIHGNLGIPAHFTVPAQSSDWPSEYWNFKLGSAVWKMRIGKDHMDRHGELDAMGLSFHEQKKRAFK